MGKSSILWAFRGLWSPLFAKDLVIIPLLIIKFLAPWRLILDIRDMRRTHGMKEWRRILQRDGVRPVEDYLTIFLACVLLLSVWRSTEVLSIIIIHAKQQYSGESPTSSLFRKIFRQFLQLTIDFLMFFLILFILLLITEVRNFLGRVGHFYCLYKERRGFQSYSFIKKFCLRRTGKGPVPVSKAKNLASLNKNIFGYLCEFLDVQTLGNLSCTSVGMRELTDSQLIWKNQYETWKSNHREGAMSEILYEDDYKRLAVESYLEFKNEHQNEILDENERDYRLGARGIVLEEFVLSIFGFPHLIAIPSKIIAYLLGKINFNDYFQTPRYPSLGFEVFLLDSSISQVYFTMSTLPGLSEDLMASFYHIQLRFVDKSLALCLLISEQIAFALCCFMFFMIRVISLCSYSRFIPSASGPDLASFAHFLQLLAVFLLSFLQVIVGSVPFYISYVHLNYSVLGSILGPALLNLFFCFSVIISGFTMKKYLSQFSNFRPNLGLRYLTAQASYSYKELLCKKILFPCAVCALLIPYIYSRTFNI